MTPADPTLPAVDVSDISYSRRNSAFGVVEYLLYGYAIFNFIADINAANITNDRRLLGGLVLVAMCFLFVVVRNYAVMQSIDKDESSPSESYRFVEIQGPIASAIERSVRLAIIILVVLAPRKTYGDISDLVAWMMHHVASAVEWVFGGLVGQPEWIGAPGINDKLAAYHEALSYYGAVLLCLSILFLAWDIVGLAGYKARQGEGAELGVDLEAPNIENEAYRSWLMYINMYKIRPQAADRIKKLISVPGPFYTAGTDDQLRDGHAGWLYMKSWKFLERVTLVFTSLAILLCAVSDMSPVAIAITFALFTAYVAFAAQNQRYIRDFWRSVVYPYWYWVKRRPQAGAEPKLRAFG